MIINIRGTHGSGKSTIVRQLIERFNGTPIEPNHKGKALGYRMETFFGTLYAVGDYTTGCGGCDSITPYSDIWTRVERFSNLGHVVFEGALTSSCYGTVGTNSEAYGDQFVFAFLDTPLDVCIQRIEERRRLRGDSRPLNPKNTKFKHRVNLRCLKDFRDNRNRRVIVLNYRKPVAQILGLLLHG